MNLSQLKIWACAACLVVTSALSAQAQGNHFNTPGNILISDQYNNRLIEVNPTTHRIVWHFGNGSSLAGPHSVVGVNDARRVGWLTLVGVTVASGKLAGAQRGTLDLKIEDVMTSQDLKDTGLSGLTTPQRTALNIWLNRYTETVIKVAAGAKAEGPNPRTNGGSDCASAVESTIKGDFEGWEGETIFQLDNGQIWQQAEYDYTYSYQYRPDVTIYQTSGGCRMKVEDESETIGVKRIH